MQVTLDPDIIVFEDIESLPDTTQGCGPLYRNNNDLDYNTEYLKSSPPPKNKPKNCL